MHTYRPLIAYLSQNSEPATDNIRGIATLATIEDIQTDEDGKIRSASIAGVCVCV